jgi:hypothetical protein
VSRAQGISISSTTSSSAAARSTASQRLRKTNADLTEALHGGKRGLDTEKDNKYQE